MPNNPSKFFRKILKNSFLVTASGAAIMLSSSGALGAARTTTAINVNLNTGANLDGGGAFALGSTLQFTGVHNVSGFNKNVLAINMNGFSTNAAVTVSSSLGSITDLTGGNNVLAMTISNNQTLTLTGTGSGGLGFAVADNIYTGLGNITLGGATAGLTINSAIPANLTTLAGTIDGAGNLLVSTPTTFNAAIGAVTPLASVTFNNGNGLNAATAKAITTTTVTIGKDAANNASAVSTGKIGGTVNFTADGQLTVDGGVTGAVTTAVNNEGTVIVTAGNVAAVGGVGKSLKQVTFNGASTLGGAITAQAITINGANGAVVANAGAITGNVNITSGTLTTNQVITGDLDVSGGGNLAGAAATTDVTGTVTLQATAGNVAIKNATGAVAVAGGTLDLVNATGDMTITGGTVNQTGTIGGNLAVSGGGNLAGDAAVTDVTGTVTLFGAGVVTIKDALNAAAVSVGGGTLNLRNAKGIDFDLGAGAGTTVTVAVGGDVKNVQNTTPAGGVGILTFAGVGQAGIIGNANSLSAMNVGAGEVTISGDVVKANAINLTNDASVLTFTNVAGVAVTGAIDNTDNANNGVVNFNGAGNNSVSGKIGGRDLGGGNTSFIKTLNANVTANNAITLSGDVYTEALVFDGAAGGAAVGTVKIAGNLIATNVNFGANNDGGTLEFNGAEIKNAGVTVPYIFNGAIANADKGTLQVNTNFLIANNKSVANLKAINIVDTKILFLDATAGDITLPAVKTITFAGANSGLGFSNVGNRGNAKIIFSGDFPAPGNNQGKLVFSGDNNALTVISDNPANIWKIGTTVGPVRFANLSVLDQVIVDTTINLSGIAELDVINGANFVDQGATTAQIATINIGAAYPLYNVASGSATHTIDVSTVAAAVNLPGGNVKFLNAGSTFKLQNTVAGNKTVTLTNNIVGGVGGAGNGGIVELNAADVGGTLTINGGKTLGTDANKLQTLKLSGNGTIVLGAPGLPVDYFATNLDLSIKAVTLANITQPLAFSGNTILTATGNITSVDFKGFNATINMANGTKITGTVTNTVTPPTNNGTINFAGTGQIGGNISGLAMLKAGAGAVTLSAGGATKITEIQGTGTDTLTLGPDFKLTGAINSTGGTAVKLNFTNGGSVSGVVGTAANSVGGITTAGTTTFTSAVNSKGPITTAGNTTFSNSLNNIGDVTTSGTTIFTGAYTNAGTATFGGTTNFASTFNNTGSVTTSGTTTYTGAYTNKGASTFGGTTNFASTFNNTGVVATTGTTTYTGAYTNAGNATFGGTTSFADTFNNTGAVTLAPASINNFAKNVTATSFVANNATMNFGNSLAFNSGLTGSGTTINLGSGQLAYTAQGSFTDTLTLNSNFDGATNSGGNILITGANSKMDLSGVTKLKLVISTTNFDVNNVNPNTKYTLILAQDGGSLTELSSADIIETTIGNQENRFLKWTLNPSSLVLTASNISPEVIANATKDAPANVKEALEILARAPADSEAGQFEDKLGLIIDNKALVTEVIDSLQPDTVRTGDAVAAINTQATSGAITSAITSLSSRMNNLQVANNQNAAVSAGEEDEAKFGIWATPFVGNSTQKMRNNVNGNKSNFNGATVGFDCMLNDNLVLGVAYTRADSKIKQKNDKIGDSSKVNSNIYSIYGLYNLPTNNLFFEAVGSYGDSRVKNRTQHLLPTARNTITSQIAHGKYKSRSYTGQVMVGYDYVTAQANLTPMAGIRYSNIKDSGYTETGTTLQNLIVKGKKYNIVEGLAGAKVSTNVNVDQVILTPELYGLINYGFKNKAPAIDARLQGMDAPFPTNSFKSPKVSYNLGAGVTAKYQMMEYGINYDVNIASKYFAQQGSLKVRVNF